MRVAPHVVAIAAALPCVLASAHDASACSCVGPQLSLLGPDRADDAPLNTRVRVELPSWAGGGGAGGAGGGGTNIVLRAHGGADVETTARTLRPGGSLAIVELVPKAPLAPGTRYEVAAIDPTAHPSVTVVGTFKTSTTTDTVAPRLDTVGAARVGRNAHAIGSMCQIAGPWVTIDAVTAQDPGRPSAQLLFGVWLGDAAGNVDSKKPPTAILATDGGALHVGQRTLCDPRGFALPSAGVVWLGIAALDEAGNASAIRRVKVDLGAKAP